MHTQAIQLSLFGDNRSQVVEEVQIKWSYSRRNELERCLRQYYYHYYGANAQLALSSDSPFESLEAKREDEDWQVIASDTGQIRHLRFENAEDARLMADLVQRYILAQLDKQPDLWRVDSPRIFCEAEPFQVEEGICAYHRYHVSVIPIEGEGLGVVTHVSTSLSSRAARRS